MGDFDKRVGKRDEEHKPLITTPELPETIRSRDDLGLSMDPQDWAKSNCNRGCWGRGVITEVSTDLKGIMTGNAAVEGSGNKVKRITICDCASRAYRRVRVPLEDAVLSIWNNESLDEEKKVEASLAVIEKAHAQVKNAGHLNRADLVKLATEILARKLVVPK